MGQRKCILCGVALKAGPAGDAHYETLRHRRREKGFRRSYGRELSRKLESLMTRWSRLNAAPARRK